MTNQHPITPPPELVQQWASEWMQLQYVNRDNYMATCAAQWGADQELDACCKWLGPLGIKGGYNLRRARRPKPPSLKEQALTALSHLLSGSAQTLDTTEAEYYIRRALEALPND